MTGAAARRETPRARSGDLAGAEIVRGKRVHFMGIGGIGVSALADLARAAGATVSGCDLKVAGRALAFSREGVKVLAGHSPSHLEDVDILVHTGAVRPDEPEILAAHALGIEVVDRLPMLLKLAEGRKLLGVAGAHGKTTTSALMSSLLVEAGLDPTCAIGGVSEALGGNARAGRGEWFVAEIDESDGHIAGAACEIAVVTNVDREHLDHYSDLDQVRAAFSAFMRNTDPAGAVVACADSAAAAMLARAAGRGEGGTGGPRVVLYGMSDWADFRAANVRPDARGSTFDAVTPSGVIRDLRVSIPGVHIVQNAMAVVAVAGIMGLGEVPLRRALERTSRVGRRFEVRPLPNGARMVVDYAHHPAKVAAVVAAARLGAPGRLVAVFQPHRFTRTLHLGAEFGPAFAGWTPAHLEAARAHGLAPSGVDELILLPIYPAGEKPIEGVTSAIVADAARRAGVESVVSCGSREEAVGCLARTLGAADTLLVLGAGDVDALAGELGERLANPVEQGPVG